MKRVDKIFLCLSASIAISGCGSDNWYSECAPLGVTVPEFVVTVYDAETDEKLCWTDDVGGFAGHVKRGECEFIYEDGDLSNSKHITTILDGYEEHTEKNVKSSRTLPCESTESLTRYVDVYLAKPAQ